MNVDINQTRHYQLTRGIDNRLRSFFDFADLRNVAIDNKNIALLIDAVRGVYYPSVFY
jgi:hypothetical protein